MSSLSKVVALEQVEESFSVVQALREVLLGLDLPARDELGHSREELGVVLVGDDES